MAAELKSKKRKSADISSITAKKSKKTDGVELASAAAAPAKQAKQGKVAVSNGSIPHLDGAVKAKASPARAPHTLNDEEDGGIGLNQPEKAKITEKTTEKPVFQRKASKSKHGPKTVPPADGVEEAEDSADEPDDEIDDQTAALLKGFESSSEDEEDSESRDDAGIDVGQLPEPPKKKQLQKQLEAASKSADGPGVIYIGRIPHGFYEHQMKAYFSQFGDINRLRLSRNKKTGQSKHYAFVEFQSGEVAEIVAKTMNNYLLFQHLLKVRMVPAEQVHPNLFRGAGTRFKVVPRNKIQGRHLRLGMDREAWEKRLTREEARREKKNERLKAMGYEFAAPALKGVGEVPLKASVDGEKKQVAGEEEESQGRVILEGEQDGGLDPATDGRDEETEEAEEVRAAMRAPGTREQAAEKKSKGAKVGVERVKASSRKQKSVVGRAGGASMAAQKA